MLTLEPKIGKFLLNTTGSTDLQEAFNKIFSEYLNLKILSLEAKSLELEKKHNLNYEEFKEFYKLNHTEEIEMDFYSWDEITSLLDYYKEIFKDWN